MIVIKLDENKLDNRDEMKMPRTCVDCPFVVIDELTEHGEWTGDLQYRCSLQFKHYYIQGLLDDGFVDENEVSHDEILRPEDCCPLISIEEEPT